MKRRSISVCVVMVLAILAFGIPCAFQSAGLSGIERLRQDARGQVEITCNPLLGTPSFIRGRIPLAAKGLRGEMSAVQKAVAFIDGYADVFGVARASQELRVIEDRVDSTGMRHVTLGQVHNGIEVYNALMKVHLSADGRDVAAVSSGFVPDIRLTDTQARLSADEALATAQRALRNGMLTSRPRLVVYPGVGSELGTPAKLAWLVELRDDTAPARNIYVVDALDGTICDVLSRLFAENPDTLASSGQSELFYDTMALRKKSVARFSAIGYDTRPATADIGYAVIVEGRSEEWWKELYADWYFRYCAETAYQCLRALGFGDDRIVYLSSSERDLDGDGENDTDGSSSKSNLESAIREWAGARVGPESPLILVLASHGQEDVFFLDVGLTSYDLDQWLNELPDGTPMFVYVESCYSGSFISAEYSDISAPNRVIVTSSHDDEKVLPCFNAHFTLDFWLHLQQGQDVRRAFIEAAKDANHKATPLHPLLSCRPWLDDNGDAVGTSPEDLEQNTPESAGDEGWLASDMALGLAGVLRSVGEGAPNPEVFRASYTRNGGATILGLPVDRAHRWGNGYTQHFRGGQGYEGAIMQPDGSETAYAVYGSIWSKYLGLGGPIEALGYPTSDEVDAPVSSVTGARCRYNRFMGGVIAHRRYTEGHEAKTVFLGWGVFSKWEQLGLGQGILGLPVSDEREAPSSGAGGFRTSGVVCDFEAGHLHWHRDGEYTNKGFETHGAIDGVYMDLGGSESWLGFPITDEYTNDSGYPQSDFEGGFIATFDGVCYQAFPHGDTYKYSFLVLARGPAEAEMSDSGVPASFSIAQASFESDWNRWTLSRDYNNFHGIRCSPPHETGRSEDNCITLGRLSYDWNTYSTASAGFLWHGRWLHGNPRYANAFNFIDEPADFTRQIAVAAYSEDNPEWYASIVTGRIAAWNLTRYDNQETPFVGIYYGNGSLSGQPVFSAASDVISFDWGDDGAQSRDFTLGPVYERSVGPDDFGVRWIARRRFDAGRYRFHAVTDDGVRLKVDGDLVIDHWHDQPPTEWTGDISLCDGLHWIRIEYYEQDGTAAARVWWESAGGDRETHNANHTYTLPGTLARSECEPPLGDQDVDNAHEFAGTTYDYYWSTHRRNSYDDHGARIVSTVHYGRAYMSARWNGDQVIYGDGLPVRDIVAHELTHAVTQHSADLEYRWQSGALNESFSDFFATMVDREDWTVGEDLPPNILAGRPAIRDLSDPSRLGQPDHVRDWVQTCSDEEGVHTNSGITNKAFYNLAVAVGRDKAERILYRALTVYLQSTSSLEDARAAALQSAEDLYGSDGPEYTAVRDALDAVGLDGEWNPPANDCGCGATVALSDETMFPDPLSVRDVAATLYQLRDQVLDTTPVGQRYRTLYDQYAGRISYLMLRDPRLRSASAELLRKLAPGLLALSGGSGDGIVITAEMLGDIVSLAECMAAVDRTYGGGMLAQIMEQEADRVDLKNLDAMTFEEGWDYINMSAARPYSLTLPVILKRS